MPFNRKQFRGRFPFFLPLLLLRVLVSGALVYWLWNWLLPSLLGLHLITYWQAVAFWILCRLLFGSHTAWKSSHRPQERFWKGERGRGKWMQMTPEERDKFQQEWRNRCKKKE